MKLGEIEKRVTSSGVNKQLKKTFNHEIDFNKLTPALAMDILESTKSDIQSFKLKGENSNTNAKYLNAVLTIEALEKWLTEKRMPSKNIPTQAKADAKAVVVEKFGDNANATQALRLLVGSQNFAKAKRALEMARAGKSVPANFMEGLFPLLDLLENVMSGSIANTRVLQQLDKRAKAQLKIKEHYLKEGEMESAELVLAAKDMVDQLQKMQEQLGELMNENLPPLVDAIRDEMGQEKADAFQTAAKGTLEQALTGTESARSGMDSASRLLTGEQTGIDLGADPEGSDAMEPVADLDLDVDSDGDRDVMDLDSEPSGTEGEPGLDREER
jgi:hypothetical protein